MENLASAQSRLLSHSPSLRITWKLRAMAASDLPESLQESIKSTKTEYRRLGNSGLRVSVPVLGSMSFGVTTWLPWLIDEDKVCVPVARTGAQWTCFETVRLAYTAWSQYCRLFRSWKPHMTEAWTRYDALFVNFARHVFKGLIGISSGIRPMYIQMVSQSRSSPKPSRNTKFPAKS